MCVLMTEEQFEAMPYVSAWIIPQPLKDSQRDSILLSFSTTIALRDSMSNLDVTATELLNACITELNQQD